MSNGSIVYLVGFEKDIGESSKEGGFMSEHGVKLVRGVTLTSQLQTSDSIIYSCSVNIDPV